MSTTVEEWRPVVGYEGLYEVSDWGRVRGVERLVWNPGRRAPGYQRVKATMKRPWTGGPYPIVRLCEDGKKFTVPVHRLVAEAFIGPPPTKKHEVCHREGVAAGDHVENLYWGTRLENMADAIRHGTQAKHGAHGMAKLTQEDVDEIRRMRAQKIKLRVIAAKFNVGLENVSMVARGITWK